MKFTLVYFGFHNMINLNQSLTWLHAIDDKTLVVDVVDGILVHHDDTEENNNDASDCLCLLHDICEENVFDDPVPLLNNSGTF